MIQPVMIPLVGNTYQTHMPQQMQPMPQQVQQQPMHPMEAMHPPMQVHQMEAAQKSQENHLPPSAILHHIAQQIIAQRFMDAQREQEEAQNTNELQQAEVEQQPQPQQQQQQPQYIVPEGMVEQRIPIPEEILSQINRLPPGRGGMIVVSEDSEEVPQQEVRIVQQPRQGAAEMNARQAYARGIPVHIPVPMMQQESQQDVQEPQAVATEEARPHCEY